jgi:hypothetical protein
MVVKSLWKSNVTSRITKLPNFSILNSSTKLAKNIKLFKIFFEKWAVDHRTLKKKRTLEVAMEVEVTTDQLAIITVHLQSESITRLPGTHTEEI